MHNTVLLYIFASDTMSQVVTHNIITKCVEKYENRKRDMEKGAGKSHSCHIAWADNSER